MNYYKLENLTNEELELAVPAHIEDMKEELNDRIQERVDNGEDYEQAVRIELELCYQLSDVEVGDDDVTVDPL